MSCTTTRDLPRSELAARIAALEASIPGVVASLSTEALEARFPEDVLGAPLPTRHFLMHLHGHLTYHLGQIDYLRRIADQPGSNM